jgi:hypothetical protein
MNQGAVRGERGEHEVEMGFVPPTRGLIEFNVAGAFDNVIADAMECVINRLSIPLHMPIRHSLESYV